MFGIKRASINMIIGKPKATVLMVHDEFDNSARLLLAKAELILKQASLPKNVGDLDRLSLLGFSSVKNVVDANTVQRNIRAAQETASLILKYSKLYPFNKFIEADEVKRICKKYGLVHGDSRKFIGEMPEKNQKELLAFQCRREDISPRNNLTQDYYRGDSQKNPFFTIVAQRSEFNITSEEINSDFELVDKDPIVLCHVNGGYLVVTAWGAEAMEVAHEKLN